MEKSQDRLDILKKINDYERQGKWNLEVENDPETIELLPSKVDYLNKKLSSKIATKIANIMGTNFFETMLKNGQMIIKEIKGIENYLAVDGGAMITCNHFNACDNYAVYKAILPYLGKRKLYKVIREGNYTNFPGPIGFFFRHCNTLPLSSNSETMKKFMVAVNTLLNRGEKILIYPEQAMWWNYNKPRPMKSGAFKFAVKNDVPVIPAFITTEETDKLDADGANVLACKIHFLPPLYPDKNLNEKERAEKLKDENYAAWKNLYEEVYGKALTYGE